MIKKFLGTISAGFVIIGLFLGLFVPDLFDDYVIWLGTRIGDAFSGLIDRVPENTLTPPGGTL